MSHLTTEGLFKGLMTELGKNGPESSLTSWTEKIANLGDELVNLDNDTQLSNELSVQISKLNPEELYLLISYLILYDGNSFYQDRCPRKYLVLRMAMDQILRRATLPTPV